MSVAGYISDQDRAELILHHGEITADDLPFGNKSAPFRISLLQKPGADFAQYGPALIECQLIGDIEGSAFPVEDLRELNNSGNVGTGDRLPIWSHKNIVFISDAPNVQDLLEHYRLFWTSGDPSPLD